MQRHYAAQLIKCHIVALNVNTNFLAVDKV
jgi:hypothetical protein